MDQFNNRMDAQRRVLRVVNTAQRWQEELCGLSAKAIERWIRVNQIPADGRASGLVVAISELLFFLATKSQDQLSKEYTTLFADVESLTDNLEKELA